MKIYIHTDLEGVSGVDRADMAYEGSADYPYCCDRLMADLNAAIDGAFLGGAAQVVVMDGHGGSRLNNFDLSKLDRRARYDARENGAWYGMLDASYDGTLFIGAHAMAGTINAFLDHTQSSVHWYNYFVNGCRMGELCQWAMMAGHFNVPMLMVSGDQAAVNEAYAFFNPLETAVVKRGVGRNSAELVDPGEAVERIRQAARRSISLIGKARPFRPILPMDIRLEMTRSDYCDSIAKQPGVERLDARTVRKVAHCYLDALL